MTRLEIENNHSLKRIAAALERAVEILDLINDNLDAIYNDPPYVAKDQEGSESE